MAIADQGLFASSGFLVNVLLARWLIPEEYGAYALAFSLFVFLSGFQNALLLEPMSLFCPASYRNSLPEYTGRLIWLHFGVTLVLAIVLAGGGAVVTLLHGSGAVSDALWGLGLGIPWMLFFWMERRVAYLDLRPEVAAQGAAANSFAGVLLIVLLRHFDRLSPFSVFLAQGAAGLIASLLLMFTLRPHLRFSAIDREMRKVLKEHWRYGRWVVLAAFSCWLAGDVYYWILGSAASIGEVGAFRGLQNLVRPVTQFIAAITLLLVPWASARLSDSSTATFLHGIRRITTIFTGLALAYALGLVLFGKWITAVLYGGRYIQYAYLLPVVTLPVLFAAAAEGPAIAVRAMQSPSELFWAYTAAAVPTVLGGFFFVRRWGILGAVLGLAISSFVFSAVINYRYRLKTKRQNDESEERLRLISSPLAPASTPISPWRKIPALFRKEDMRRNPIKGLVRRVSWRLRWQVSDKPWLIRTEGSLSLLVPRGGAGALIYYQGASEPEIAMFIRHFLKPGMVFVDVGAHLGEYTMLAAAALQGTGCVHAFEPRPDIFEILSRNARLNGFWNIAANANAVWHRNGYCEFELTPEPSVSAVRPGGIAARPNALIRVNTVTLDDYFADSQKVKPALVKVDVEGAELFVFQGAHSLLTLPPEEAPVLIFEYGPVKARTSGYSAEDICALLRRSGYAIFQWGRSGLVSVQDAPQLPEMSHTCNLIATKIAERIGHQEMPFLGCGRSPASEILR